MPLDRICVHVTQSTKANQLKVVWHDGGRPFLPYLIDRDDLKHAAWRVRDRVRDYVKAVSSHPPTECRDDLSRLATSGAELRQVIFSRVGGDQDVDEVTKWLAEKTPGRHSIEFIIDDRIYVPWGLAYDSDDDTSKRADSSTVKCENFWAMRYRVTAAHYRITPASLKAIARTDMELICVTNADVYRKSQRFLRKNERKAIRAVLAQDGELVTSKNDLYRRWKCRSKPAAILYFYCHGTGAELTLSRNEALTHTDWKTQLWNESHKHWTLVILNGCETAAGSSDGGFIEATGSGGFYGFIGAEGILPPGFAMRFGAELIHRLLTTEESVSTIMTEMRRKHWPLGLLYGVYCRPDIAITSNACRVPDAAPSTGTF